MLQCNNPLTKEAKLKAAVRIAPEWADYDGEIREFQAAVKAGRLSENASAGEATRLWLDPVSLYGCWCWASVNRLTGD